jgi:hypothetical protein
VGGYEAYKTAELLQKNMGVLLKRVHDMPENDDDVIYFIKSAKLLTDKGVLVGLENSGNGI